MAVVDLSGHSTYRQRRFGVQYHGILFCSPVIGVRYDWFADSSDTFINETLPHHYTPPQSPESAKPEEACAASARLCLVI